jgi:very-short-patch-repair endonuclease
VRLAEDFSAILKAGPVDINLVEHRTMSPTRSPRCGLDGLRFVLERKETRRQRLGVRFRRRVPTGPYVADFAFLDPRLVVGIERSVDDGVDQSAAPGASNHRGFSVIRFGNDHGEEDTVADSIRRSLERGPSSSC